MSPSTILSIVQRLIAIAFLTLVSSPCWSQVTVAERAQRNDTAKYLQPVADYADHLVDSGEVPGVVILVAHNGKIGLQRAVGLAGLSPQREMKPDTIFRIASMTKPITSVAAMILVDEGRLKLGDPVSKYIPEFVEPLVVTANGARRASKAITIHNLLTHTSGLVYDNAPQVGDLYQRAGIETGVNRSSLNLEENIARLAQLPLAFEPEERFHYGMSTDVLGLVIQRVAKMPLDVFIQQRICAPLGMRDTFFHVPAEKRHRLAATFVQDDQKLREIGDCERIQNGTFKVRMSPDHATDDTHQYLSGGGGLCSTAEDYFRFCQALVDGGTSNGKVLLRPETVAMMTENRIGDLEAGNLGEVKFGFGYGFAIFPQVGGRNREISWGGIWGTNFRISLADKWVGIILTQRVLDDSMAPREIQFTRLVREAMSQGR